MGQLTKFAPNGSCRIDSTDNPDIDTSDIVNVAFKDPNGSLVLTITTRLHSAGQHHGDLSLECE